MSRILLIEDHVALRASMADVLTQLPGADVTAVGTISGAKHALASRLPDLIISDLDLPDGSGIELMGHHGAGVDVPVIFISAHVPRFAKQLRDYPGVTVREKPLPLRDLKNLASTHLEEPPPTNDAPFGAAEYVQLACMGRHSVRVDVDTDTVRGSIIVRDGRLWSAQAGKVAGPAALERLTVDVVGRVRCVSLSSDEVPASNLPDKPWEQLLLDAARVHDESVRAEAKRNRVADDDPLDLDALFNEETTRVADVPVNGHSFEQEVDRGADALLRKDYRTALQAYERAHAIRPDDRLVKTNVARLQELIQRTEENEENQ